MITFGGQPLTQTVPNQDDTAMSDMSFALWDNFIGMMCHRENAIQLRDRIARLHDLMDSNRDHPNYEVAARRAEECESKLRESEREFLNCERAADAYWQRMTLGQRIEEDAAEMFAVPPQQETLIGMWRHPLGASPIPARGHRISSTVLAFAVPAQQREYGR